MAGAEQNPYAPPAHEPVLEAPWVPAPETSPAAPLLARLYLGSTFVFLTVGGAFAATTRGPRASVP